jgi:hypothetical protein
MVQNSPSNDKLDDKFAKKMDPKGKKNGNFEKIQRALPKGIFWCVKTFNHANHSMR